MNLLSVLLQAQAQGATGGSYFWIMMIVMFAIIYFFMIRPQNKKQKAVRQFRANLAIGDQVVTAGGIHGVIKELQDTAVVLEIANNVRITVEKSSIYKTGAAANEGK
jgi:preprotein translocase subunit YajC